MRVLNHIGLAVRDPGRSLQFYREALRLEGVTREEDYGFVITTTNGVAFALLQGNPPASIGDFHFGLSLATPDEVRALREHVHALGITEVEWWDEPGYVSVKVLDPDGYVVEIGWDAKHKV